MELKQRGWQPVGASALRRDDRVSVVIPAYNSAAFLAETLRSVLAQTQPVHEIIVVDDGSVDETVAVAKSFGVTVLSLVNGGPARARNAGVRAATGDFIAFLDADDIWTSDKLQTQLAALTAFGRPGFSFTDYREFDTRGPRRHRSQLLRAAAFRKAIRNAKQPGVYVMEDDGRTPVLYGSSYIAPSTVMIRRADILALGGFDETLRYCEDYEFFLRLFRYRPAVVVRRPLVLYRKHAESLTANWIRRPSHLNVAQRVAAAPHRYPRGDVRHFAQNGHRRHLSIAFALARYGHFDEASVSSRASLAQRWNVGAWLLLAVCHVCSTRAGRAGFDAIRTAWRSWPYRR